MPTEGEVRIGEASLYEMTEDERSDYRCKTIGFVFQDFFLEELYTVYQNLNQTNSVYKKSVIQYQGANNNLYFDYILILIIMGYIYLQFIVGLLIKRK